MSEDLVENELPEIGFLSNLDDDDRRLLGDYGTFVPVHEGQEIIKEGDPQGHLYLVISGKLRVQTSQLGKTVVLAEVGCGGTLGEVNLFDPDRASASVVAMEFSQVWKIGRYDFDAYMETYPVPTARILVGMMAAVSKRLRAMNQKLSAAEVDAVERTIW